MRPRLIVSAALACGLTAVSLAVPAAAAYRAPVADTPTAGVPALRLLAGPGPTTVTVDAPPAGPVATTPTALLLRVIDCDTTDPTTGTDHVRAGQPAPCQPAQSTWTPGATVALVKQPGAGGFDGHAVPASVWPASHALRMLHQLLPRSDLPAGRAPRQDPRPA